MDSRNYFGDEIYPSQPPTQDERTLAILAHILTIFGWIFAPLIIYLLRKDESSFVRHHALESLNFQITLTICLIASIPLVFVLIGILLLWIIPILALILVIVATIKASENKLYRYPINFRIIR